MTQQTRQKRWYLLLTRAQLRWSHLPGYLPFFQLAIKDYQARIKRVVETTPSSALFTEEEIISRRYQNQSVASATADSQQPASPFRKKWLPSLFKKRGSEKPETTLDTQLPLISEPTVADLFTRAQREAKLLPLLKQQRQAFRKRHRRALVLFGRYEKLISEAPSDEIDFEIVQLRQNYEHLGRIREWFTAFNALAEEAVAAARQKSANAEYNEDPIRVLQRDFLTTMQARLGAYRRLDELRTEAFLHEDPAAIRMISYFNFRQDTPDAFVDSSRDFSDIDRFVASLEYQLGLSRKRSRAIASSDKPGIADVHNPEERLHAWQDFKKRGTKDFNALKHIASQCEDWQREVELFQSETEVSRLENEGSIDNQIERVALEQFIESLSQRIGDEIETDIAFQQLISDLIRSNENPDMLHLVLEQLKLARSRNDSPEMILTLKADFVARQSEGRDEADVIPLFRQR